MKSKRSKTKSSLSIDSKVFHFVLTAGIKVYPVYIKGAWYIEADNNNRIKRFEKKLKQNEINDAMVKTVNWYYDQLKQKEKQNGTNKGNNN